MASIKRIAGRWYDRLAYILALPIYLRYFFDPCVGLSCRLGFLGKLRLILRFRSNTHRIPSLSHWTEHLRMAAEILSLPPSIPGDVIECGCYKGSSSANLSIACALAGRRFIICDSFAGLPEPEGADRSHYLLFKKWRVDYKGGQWAGALAEVRRNIESWGRPEVCEFVEGYFENTLPNLDRRYALAFLDVDLNRSLEDCLRSIWPRLAEGGWLFSHEAEDLEFVSLFFNDDWWKREFNCKAPGFVGAGTGLPLGIGRGSAIGYTIKTPEGGRNNTEYPAT